VGRSDLIGGPSPKRPTRAELLPVREFKLKNGLQVFVLKSDRLPVVSFQIAIRAGRKQEPKARLGVAEATADMLVKGTKQHDAVGLAQAIDLVGGTISVNATFEATLLSCSVLAWHQASCLRLLPEVLTQSTFPENELVKVKEGMVASVRQRLDEASDLAGAHVQNLLWGDHHVRGWINSEQSVGALKRSDVVAWAQTWFVPGNAMLVVAGDVDPGALQALLERSFAAWKPASIPPTPTYAEPALSGVRIRLVDKPGQTQTHIRVAQLGIRHDDPRYFDTMVWNYALGGGAFSSRLMKVVRIDSGKTYGASSSFDHNMERGSFVAQTFTRNAEAVATAKLVVAEIAKMAQQGPSQEEVSAAISNIAGGYALRYQSAADLGSALVGAELHGFGMDYLSNFPLAVANVDATTAKRSAGEILDPRHYVIVMVGDAKDLEPQLRREGWKYDKVSFSDPISAQAAAPAPAVSPGALAAAKRLIADALVAKGGSAKLAGVKSIRMVASGTTTIQGQSHPVEIERVFVVPDKLRIEATLAKQTKVVVALNGDTGWQVAPDPKTGQTRTIDLEGPEKAAARFEAWRDPEFILLKAADPAAKLVPQPDQKIDGREMSVIALGSAVGAVDVAIYIDKASKLVRRMAYTEQGQSEVDDFSDYKNVSGLQVAHTRISSSQGRSTKLTIHKVEINGPADAKLFQKP
jgi:zinc protease